MSSAERILKMVEHVRRDESAIGVFSTGEKIAVALVLDRKDLLDDVNGGYTMLEAIERLGTEWTRAALIVQRSLDIGAVKDRTFDLLEALNVADEVIETLTNIIGDDPKYPAPLMASVARRHRAVRAALAKAEGRS